VLDILERVEDETEFIINHDENRNYLFETVKKINNGTARLITFTEREFDEYVERQLNESNL
jgi:chaperonin GroEL (HSP60 family)